jgi:hypothetical protein
MYPNGTEELLGKKAPDEVFQHFLERLQKGRATGAGLGSVLLGDRSSQRDQVHGLDGPRRDQKPWIDRASEVEGATIERNEATQSDDGNEEGLDLLPDRDHHTGDVRSIGIESEPAREAIGQPGSVVAGMSRRPLNFA